MGHPTAVVDTFLATRDHPMHAALVEVVKQWMAATT